jgi:PilZ domain
VTDVLNSAELDRIEKRISVALPVRVTYYDSEAKPRLEMACTYDISAHGARVTGLRNVKEAGEILVVERGRSKAFCRVVWIGEPDSPLRGQVGIQCVEAQKSLWTAELRDMEETYEAVSRDSALYRVKPGTSGNRRRHQRFVTEGKAKLLETSIASHLEGTLRDVSEVGCLIATQSLIRPGTDLKLVLKVASYDLSLKGQVKHAAIDVGLGIEFREIRKGDRDVLQYLLHKLAEKEKTVQCMREQQRAASAAAAR